MGEDVSKSQNFHHLPVLLDEVMEGLKLRPGGFYVDCTAGGGGHSEEILKRTAPDGRLLAIDCDPAAVKATTVRLKPFEGRYQVVCDNFCNLPGILERVGVFKVDGILFDLGVSSHHLDSPERGFSYSHDSLLDMRMDPSNPVTASDLVNELSRDELARIIASYGEEKWADRIASFIVRERKKAPILTTGELVRIVKEAIPAAARRKGPHPARRTFQALRIAVNRELEVLERSLRSAVEHLVPGGRICVISFHSLEDRVVKRLFNELADPCRCPSHFPVCVCGREPVLTLVTRRPVFPSAQEVDRNPRSRSARLRIAEKLPGRPVSDLPETYRSKNAGG